MSVQDHDGAFETEEISDAAARSKPDGALNPAGEAGWYLERERERRGETLETISEAIGIHPYHLSAIESGDLTRLPVRLEALQMIGIYAQHLGFDPEPLVMHYAQFLPKPPLAPEASHHPADPAPLTSAKVIRFGRLPPLPKFTIHSFPGGTGGLVASCLAAIMLFAGTSYVLQPGSDMSAPTEQVAEAVDEMPPATDEEQSADVAVTEEAMPDTQEPGLKPAAEDMAGLDGLTEFLEKNPGVAEQKAGTPPQTTASIDKPAESNDGRVFGEEAGKSRLVLRAKGSVVVRIEDAKGNVVMTQVLRAGDRYRVPNKDGLVAIARDGGLLAYEIDGKEKGVLGPAGQILVGRSLDIKSLEKKG